MLEIWLRNSYRAGKIGTYFTSLISFARSGRTDLCHLHYAARMLCEAQRCRIQADTAVSSASLELAEVASSARRVADVKARGISKAGASDLGSRVFRFRTDVGSEEKRASRSSAKRFRRMFPKHHQISPSKSSEIKETELRSDGRYSRIMRRTFHQPRTSEMEPMGD